MKSNSGVGSSHAEFQNIWFCVHEKAGFKKTSVSCAREHHFFHRSRCIFPAAKSCTRFDAEGRQFLIDILWWETDMGMDRSFRVPEALFYVCGKSEKIRRSGGVRSGALKKLWFRVHENLCFEELNVSLGREHIFLDSFGQICPTGQKLHAF